MAVFSHRNLAKPSRSKNCTWLVTTNSSLIPVAAARLYIYHPYRFVIPDRNSIFAEEVDKGIANLAVGVLRTQCERRRRTRYESDWAGAFGGSVSTC